ncbi:MAG TPA: pitrilysin family protein [Labilithrix sp.]|nr:pitrilysin family protein [Labilithrix sp.]
MKRSPLLALASASLVALAACGGGDGAQPVTPALRPDGGVASPSAANDPPPVIDGAVTQQMVGGLMVLVKRIPGAELAAMQLAIRGGARNWGKADAGIERLALATAVSGGTRRLDRDAFARRLAALGSELGSSSNEDYASLEAKSLTATFDETFALLTDAFLVPVLPETELEVHRQDLLSHLRHEQESPDGRLAMKARLAVFKNHPYENRPVGTAESVASVTPAAVAAHLARLRESGRLLLVVVGDVDPAHVAVLAREKLGALPRGSFAGGPMPPITFAGPALEVEDAKLPTSYVLGQYPSATPRDPDFYAAMVANEVLGSRIFEEVRVKRNLSYAPSASLAWNSAVPLGRLYVTAVDPDTTMRVMLDEVKKLKTTPVNGKDLEGAKATYLTEHLVSSETTDGQAAWLTRAQLLTGDFRFESRLLEKVKAVSAAEVQAYANARMKNLQLQVIGPKKVDAKLFGSL